MHDEFPPYAIAAVTIRMTHASEKVLTGEFLDGLRRLVLLPETPDRDVAKIERIPPRVQHPRIQSERAFTSHARGWPHKPRHPFVHQRTFRVAHAKHQMPQRNS